MDLFYMFDLDGTLIEWNKKKPAEEVEFLPGRLEFFSEVRHNFAIITNQGGPACHDAGWRFSSNFPSLEQIALRLTRTKEILRDVCEPGIEFEIYACYVYITSNGKFLVPKALKDANLHHKWFDEIRYRKPNGGMISEALSDFGALNKLSLFVGDDQMKDGKAAELHGIDFELASLFFGV